MLNQQEFTEWLNSKYDEWIEQTWEDGQRKTLTGWQNYLDIDQNLLSYWLGGQGIPEKEEHVQQLAKLGDEIYEILDLEKE